jgi:hypothetical protein
MASQASLYRLLRCSYTSCVRYFCGTWWRFASLCFVFVMAWPVVAQEAAPTAAEKPVEKAPQKQAESKDAKSEKAELPFQIQLLETRVRFETNGDSRKEVHTIVKINNILGAREFARLAFDYNRGWQQMEIPLVRVSHANGGTSELLPSAVTDAPNPAVEKFPAYQDVRVKSARILGLQEGDTIEYRVITTTTKPPLAPEFWLEHTFDRSGQVLKERYELDLPDARKVQLQIAPTAPAREKQTSGEGEVARTVYRWSEVAPEAEKVSNAVAGQPDVVMSSYPSWDALAAQLSKAELLPEEAGDSVRAKAKELTAKTKDVQETAEALYDFVAQKIQNVELPLLVVGFRARNAGEVLESGYGTQLDKFVLLRALNNSLRGADYPLFVGDLDSLKNRIPSPLLLTHLVQRVEFPRPQIPGGSPLPSASSWVDPTLPVAAFAVISPALRGKLGLGQVTAHHSSQWWAIMLDLPFPSEQSVVVNALLSREGALTSTVKYVMRGDNELLLREAFHGTPKEKWKDVANLLAISDGFRGEISSVIVSDPLATREPFKVEYTITQAKFVDWSKKPVRIPALLPQIGLPDLPKKAADGDAPPKIELGTPLDVETQMTLKLPAGTKAVVPPGTAVNRDYARFSSKYGVAEETVTASRRVNFLLREIDGTRGMDYNAFVRAVQNDQAGMIVLEREAAEKK